MERPVKVQISLTMDLLLQPDQSEYELARTVQQQIEHLLKPHGTGKIDQIKVFEGHGDALTLPMREPAIELEGIQGIKGWELIRKDPAAKLLPTLNLRSGARNVSDPTSSAGPRGGDYYRPGQADPLLFRNHRVRWEKKAVNQKNLAAQKKAARTTIPNSSAATKLDDEKKFKHEFENPNFNDRLRKEGILGAYASNKLKRLERNRTRRSGREEQKRWIGHGKPDENQKMDILTDQFAAGFDFNAPVPSKAERRAARQSLASSVVYPKTEDVMDTSSSTEMAHGNTCTARAAGDNDRLFQVFFDDE